MSKCSMILWLYSNETAFIEPTADNSKELEDSKKKWIRSNFIASMKNSQVRGGSRIFLGEGALLRNGVLNWLVTGCKQILTANTKKKASTSSLALLQL